MNINPLINLISNIIFIYSWILLIWIILSWLIYFKIVNAYQPFVAKVNDICIKLTEPVLRPIRKLLRKILPDTGGIDLSPIILVLLLYFFQDALYQWFYR